ncbi:MAG TPA: sulfotransferase [Rhodothermales bacterium]|nr:sulfotransferase [Rhodothermales bacterium]
MDAPIFVVGANRSGTTLLRLILNSHSRIAIPEELTYFNTFLAGVRIEKWRNPPVSFERYAAFVQRFLRDNCKPLRGLDLGQIQQEILGSNTRDLKRPYQILLEAWARHHGKQRWGEKTPGNLFYADVILEMFPDAKFICMVRDPRAGVCSMMGASFFPNDVVFNALSRHKYMTEGRAILEQSVPASQRITLRYEDLVEAPAEATQFVCDFLGERYEPQMLRFYEDADRFMMPDAATDFNMAATRPISTDMRDQWMRKLDPPVVATIERICASEMSEFRYESAKHRLSLGARANLVVKTAYWNFQIRRKHHARHYTVKDEMFARFRSRFVRFAKYPRPT